MGQTSKGPSANTSKFKFIFKMERMVGYSISSSEKFARQQ